MNRARWPLASKLLAIGLGFLLLALASISLTLWVSWQLEGGAAAVNEAGRLRMQTYRLALLAQRGDAAAQRRQAADAIDTGLERLRTGDPSRPLFVPWSERTRGQFAELRARWPALRDGLLAPQPGPPPAQVESFVAQIDSFVSSIEQQLSDWTAVLRGFQFAMVLLAIASTVVLMYTGHLFVLEPLKRLQRGLGQVREGDFAARVEHTSGDEFGQLAQGFNTMAAHLQALYGQLEAKVAEKTARLEVKRQRLAALYEVSAFIAKAESLPVLAQGFAGLMRGIARADAVAVRWSDERNERYLMLASDGLPEALRTEEQCLPAGDCHCGQAAQQPPRMRVIPISSAQPAARGHCAQLGYRMLLTLPVALHQQVLGEIDLFFTTRREIAEEERTLYETLASHLAGGMESLRAAALDKEAAVAQERTLLAQELHDSIAQSLAFLKIQVGLLRQAMRRHDEAALQRSADELETGVRECYGDVRELLLHFRTRTNAEDITTALRSTVQKFEHQSGLPTELQIHGHGVPLPADVQIQVLHVLQEALSNIRKHAQARHVVITVQQTPAWRFEVRDDGRGFDPHARHGETHVGLRIMQERAARVGAQVEITSAPGRGTCMTLTLQPHDTPAPALATA